MFELIRLFFSIVLLNKTPQDIPYSRFVLQLSLMFYTVTGLILLNLSLGWMLSILQLLVALAFLFFFTIVTLYFSGKLSRFNQTASALLGTEALFNFFQLPVLSTMITGKYENITYLLLVGLMIWNWVVVGHIFRHALSKMMFFGLGIAMLFLLFSFQIQSLLFLGLTEIG